MSETVPSSFKEAKVIPLFKKGSTLDPGNYRPVSILNVMSKLLERAVHTQLTEYLNKRGLLFDNQSGFRGGYSTDTNLIFLTDYIKQESSKGNFTGMVLLDLQKAFDTVDHSILLSKLEAMGVTSLKWFESYLSNRSQCVEIDSCQSSFLPISCGVPQGSILGPLLFLVYVNDMKLSINCILSLYADDSALLFSHKDPLTISNRLSTELSNCKRWLVDNRLSLHMGKTECLLFGSQRKLKRVSNFSVSCEGTVVQRVFQAKYLGVVLDASLSGTVHATKVLKSCTGRLSFLYRNASLLDEKTRKLLCASLIQPYIDYCCSSWFSGLGVRLQSRFCALQQKMVRFIHSSHPMQHVDLSDLRALSWLSIPDRVNFFKLTHLFKIRHDLAPSYLTSQFTSVSSVHSHQTRGSVLNYHLSKSLSKAPTSFCFSASKLWNELPNEIKSIDSLPRFRRMLENRLFSRYS